MELLIKSVWILPSCPIGDRGERHLQSSWNFLNPLNKIYWISLCSWWKVYRSTEFYEMILKIYFNFHWYSMSGIIRKKFFEILEMIKKFQLYYMVNLTSLSTRIGLPFRVCINYISSVGFVTLYSSLGKKKSQLKEEFYRKFY